MIPLRLVIDTNILVSAALKPEGLQRTVLVLAITKPARLYVTKSILAEYREVLVRQELKIRKGRRQQVLQLIQNRAHLVCPTRELQVAKDPDDDKFLECADAARADYLITGNLRHFPMFWKSTKVITSREFISIVAQHFIRQRSAARSSLGDGECSAPTLAKNARMGQPRYWWVQERKKQKVGQPPRGFCSSPPKIP